MGDERLTADEIEALVRAAQIGEGGGAEEPTAPPPPSAPPPDPGPAGTVSVRKAVFPSFGEGATPAGVDHRIAFLLDVPLQVTVELGRASRLIRDVLTLGPGAIVELDKAAGEPVDILVNGRRVARGEVVVVDENFGVRITEIESPEERLSGL